MPSYYYWSLSRDIPLHLALENAGGSGATGLSPTVTIRRDTDNFYWNGTIFTSTPTALVMAEFDATNNAGLYILVFPNSTISASEVYRMYYSHQAVSPRGIDSEVHIVSNEVFIPSSSPAIPVVPGDTVLGRLAAMEDPTKAVALAMADAVWDEPLPGHLTPGSTGEALSRCTALAAGANLVTIHVEDDTVTPVAGAQVDVFDSTNTIFIGRGFTDALGDLVLGLDNGTYQLRVFASGVSFTVPEIIVVTTDPQTFTISGVLQTNVFIPSAPNLCVIFGTLVNAGGDQLVGACVQAFAVVDPIQAVGGSQLTELVAETTTNQDGFFQLELIRLSSVRFVIEEAGIEFIKTVPDLASQDLTTWP